MLRMQVLSLLLSNTAPLHFPFASLKKSKKMRDHSYCTPQRACDIQVRWIRLGEFVPFEKKQASKTTGFQSLPVQSTRLTAIYQL